MSVRKGFEEYCKRTRPPLYTGRQLMEKGWGDYIHEGTQVAWKVWQYLDKQNNPSPAKSGIPEWK